MTLLVVANDLELRLLIKSQLKKIKEIMSILECDSAEDALFILLEKQPDVIIASDVLKGRSGLELASLLRKINFSSPLIILSNNPDRAIDAIKAKVFDFLIYPFNGEKLAESVRDAMAEVKKKKGMLITEEPSPENMKIKISVPNGFSLVDLNLLSHCKADGSYSELFFTNGKVECSSYNLGKLEDILEKYHFARINRSVIVNMRMLKDVNEKEYFCVIDTGTELLRFNTTKMSVKNLAKTHLI
ncbi:MAG TPA: response regulator [Prolixibacteraceae bacterium]|nr:response regulator [Prolixibacteraceae bacterium]